MQRYLIILILIPSLYGYEYKIDNKTTKKIRVTLNFTINEESRDIAPGEFKKLDNGLRCLKSIKVLGLEEPYQSDFWDVNCNPFTGGISNCCSGFIITIDPYFRITLATQDGKVISRNYYTDHNS